MVLNNQNLFCVNVYPAPPPAFRVDGFEALNNPRWSTATALTPKRARCARCSAATRYRFAWATIGNKLWQPCSNATFHIAIAQVLQSRITQDVYASADLDTFAHPFQSSAKTLEALRVELCTTPSGQPNEGKSSPALTFPHTESPLIAQFTENETKRRRTPKETTLFLDWSRRPIYK